MNPDTQRRLAQAERQRARLVRMMARIRAKDVSEGTKRLLLEGVVAEFRSIESQIDGIAGINDSLLQAAAVRLRVMNVDHSIDYRSAQLLPVVMGGFRKGVQSIAGFLYDGRVPKRPSLRLKRAADFDVVAVAPGSLVVALDEPPPSGDPELDATVDKAIDLFMSGISWASHQEQDRLLREKVQDASLRAVVLNEVQRLTPSPRGMFSHLEVSGTRIGLGSKATVDRTTRQFVQEAATRLLTDQHETHVGVLRALDLDELRLTIRTSSIPSVRCEFNITLEPIAKIAFDSQVSVELTGIRPVVRGKFASRLRVEQLRLLS